MTIKTLIRKALRPLGFDLTRIPAQSNPSALSQWSPENLDKELQALPFSQEAIKKLVNDFEFSSVLDIGSGAGAHSDYFLSKGKKVTAVDFGTSIYFERRTNDYTCIKGDFLKIPFEETFDCIWASHVLEHQLNVNQFLQKCIACCKPGGLIAITVPPRKDQLVGGHLTLWTPGLLIYNLVMAGLDCSDASILAYGYNISVIARNIKRDDVQLDFDCGDIKRLQSFFPASFSEGNSGWIEEFNWNHQKSEKSGGD